MSISDYGQREKHHHTVMSGTVKKRPDSTPGRFLDNRVQIKENRVQRTEYREQSTENRVQITEKGASYS